MNYKNRGMFLESIINKTIVVYAKNNVGIFHKKSLPIIFSKIKREGQSLKVEKGRVTAKSTTDYYGIFQGKFVAFEAKSTKLKSLPLANIKEHQSRYLKQIHLHGGISFYIISYSTYNEFFLIEFIAMEEIEGKSLNIDIARKIGYKLELEYPGILDFACVIDKMK